VKRFRLNFATATRFAVYAIITLSLIGVFGRLDRASVLSDDNLGMISQIIQTALAGGSAPEVERPANMPDQITGKAQVYDGDTFDLIYEAPLAGRYRQTSSIRLEAVDACESRQSATFEGIKWPCGAVATAWLVARTLNRQVECHPTRMDSYGRYLATCFVDGLDIGLSGLQEGMMIAYRHRNEELPAHYEQAEAEARSSSRGLWSSDFSDPYEFRKQNGSYNPFEPNR